MGIGAIASVVGATAAVAGAAHSILGGSGGSKQSAADAAGQQANDYAQQASDLFNNLQTPEFDKTALRNQTWLQDFNPETYDPYIGQVSQISDDPASLAAQQQSLQQLQQLAKGGLSQSDMLALDQIQRSQAGAASANSAAAADALRSRGLGGAGAEYAARLAANQSTSNNASSLYDQAMKAAMDRQTAAINSSGALAGNIRNQNVNISGQMAAINNAFNSQIQQLRTNAAQNAATVRNNAQAANLAGRQGVANSNVTTANQNIANQNQLRQQDFANTTTKMSDQANALNHQQTLASANQAAFSQQALGQDQSLTAGLNGLSNIAKSVSGTGSGTGSNLGSSVSNWWNNLTQPAGGDTMTSDYGTAQYTPNSEQYLDSGAWDL